MKPTIKQVAETAGVSRGTVDRVLNGRPYVKEETKKKVMDAIEQLGYEKNWAAKALVTQNKMKRIAFILPKLESKGFRDEIYRAIEQQKEELSGFGIELVERECATRMKENRAGAQEYIQIIDEAIRDGADGMVIYTMDHPVIQEKINALTERGIPVVTVNSDVHDCRRICFVGEDEYRSGRIAGDLIRKCADMQRDILVIAASCRYYSSRARVQGFQDVLKETGCFFGEQHIFECYNSYEMTYEVVLEELRKNPDIRAVYLATESVAGCMDAIRESGQEHRLVVICHGSLAHYRELVRAEEITFLIAENIYEQGYRAIETLRDMIFYRQEPAQECMYTAPSIVCRESAW